jgi:hypothetical protein
MENKPKTKIIYTELEDKVDEFIELFESNQPFREQIRDYLFYGKGERFKEIKQELERIQHG